MKVVGDLCLVCHTPLIRDNEFGICTRNPTCRAANFAARYQEHKEEISAKGAALREALRGGQVCNRGPSGKFAMNGDEFLARKRR